MNADDTTEVLPKMTNQGDWIWDKSSESLVHVGDQNSAKLPNETLMSIIIPFQIMDLNHILILQLMVQQAFLKLTVS